MRQTLFISKATPEDDEFVLWVAPRLEANGYSVFADILTLEPGDRWRKEVTKTLQDKAIKMLLCCRNSTLERHGVQEEIGIAEDLSKELSDPRFIVPLRLEKYKKLFGIGELHYQDFSASWAHGLHELLATLERQNIPRSQNQIVINPNWENYKKRFAIKIEEDPEILTLSWLRIARFPDYIRYYQPIGAVNHLAMQRVCNAFPYPAELYLRGFFSFAEAEEIDNTFTGAGSFSLHSELLLTDFLEDGSEIPDVRPREAKNLVSSMFRKSWELLCTRRGLDRYTYSKQTGFHVTADQLPIGKKVSWGSQGQRRSSMLRNVAAGKVWQYGVSASPNFWPYPHFRLKARVLFAQLAGKEAGAIFSDADEQHRLRRSVCRGWRNKQWHGRTMAFIKLLSAGLDYIELPLSSRSAIALDAALVQVTVPVTTTRPDAMPDDGEERDPSTFGTPDTVDAA